MRSRSPIFVYLLWFALAVALPLTAIIGYGIYEKFQDERGEAFESINHARELAESRVGNDLSRTRFILQSIAEGDAAQELDLEELRDEIALFLRQRDEVKDIALIDGKGGVITEIGGFFNEAISLELASATEDRGFTIRKPFHVEGKVGWSTVMSIPVTSRARPDALALLIRVELDGLAERLLALSGPGRPPISVLTLDGVVLLRSHDSDSLIGRAFEDIETVLQKTQSGLGTGECIGIDGKLRTFSAIVLRDTGVIVIASVPTDEITADARKDLRNNTIALIFISSLVLLIAFKFSRLISDPVSRLAQVARARTEGAEKVLAEVSGPSEIADTARAFNEMIAARAAAEAAKSESEQRLDLALTGAELGLWDRNLRVSKTTYNDLYARILGYTLKELETSDYNWKDRVHPEDRERVFEQFGKHITGEHSSFQMEYRLQKKNGDWIWIQDRGRIVEWDEEGLPIRAAGTHLDITERKTAEQALSSSEHRYRFIVNNTGQIAYDADLKTDKVQWFGAVEEITGWTLDEFRDVDLIRFSDYIHADDRERIIELYERCSTSGEPLKAEYRVLTKSGGVRVVDDFGVFVKDASGTSVRNFGRIIDVTESRRAAQETRIAKERFQGIVHSIDGIVWEADPESLAFSFVSDQAERLSGYRAALWTEDPAFLVKHLHSDDRDWLPRFLLGTVALMKDHNVEFRMIRADGSTTWFQASVNVVESEGKVTLLRGVMLDVTERKMAAQEKDSLNRKLQETQKLESLGVLAGGIAHDFNNLLTGVLGNASLARLDLPGDSPVLPFIEQIEKASMRAADLCKQMLAYSGRGRFQIRRLDLNSVLRETTQLLEVSKTKKASLRFQLKEPLPPVMADVTQIRQVVMNLVINASEAIGDSGGTVTIATSAVDADREYIAQARFPHALAPGRYILMEISDSGCGMSLETVSRIFDPFFTTKFTGRGLGLSAVLGIIRGHNGAIKVYSELGKGTTFKILLPIAEGPIESRDDTTRAATPWRGSGRALVIDDEPSVLKVASRMMSAIGFSVTSAENGALGLEEFKKEPGAFSVVLLDLTMPVMDGEETFRRMRTLNPDTRVILMSGFNQQEANAHFIGRGLAGFVQKPFDVETLSAQVRKAVAETEA